MPTQQSPPLTAATSSFVLAAAITILVNTALSCLKDSYAPLKTFMRSLAGHDWTTQGLADLVLFVALGFIFMNTGVTKNIGSDRSITFLVASVTISAIGLGVWFALF